MNLGWNMRRLTRKALVLSAAMLAGATIAYAEPITLRSTDGSVTMVGELLSFDGSTYLLRSNFGDVSVDVNDVTCVGDTCPVLTPPAEPSGFIISGSRDVLDVLLPKTIEEYKRAFNLTRRLSTLDTGSGGQKLLDENGETHAVITTDLAHSGTALSSLLNGTTEMALSTRRATGTEMRAMSNAERGDLGDVNNQSLVAMDALVIILSPENPVQSLTLNEIAQIFSGNINNWIDVGGVDHAINVYRREDGSELANEFNSRILSNAGVVFSPNAQQRDNIDLVIAVGSDPHAIGFTSYTFGKTAARIVPLRGTCAFLSLATDFTIKTGEYPLTRRIYLYANDQENRSAAVTEFLNFTRTQQAQQAAFNAGFVNQSVISLPISEQGLRLVNTVLGDQNDITLVDMQQMVASLALAERLSSTFRFKARVDHLDAQAIDDIARLAEHLRTLDLTGKEVVVSGFSASTGTAGQSVSQSLQRARKIFRELRDALGTDAERIPMTSAGFGEVSPLWCNNTFDGRAINNRVEIWIRKAQ